MANNQTVTAASDVGVQAYVRLVRAADAVFSEVSSGLSSYQISPTQFSTLKALRFSGPLSQRDIGRYILKTGGNVTVIVDQLESMGFVSRIRDSEDRRVCYVNLTEKGEKFFDSVYPTYQEKVRTAMGRLTPSEQAVLAELLEKLKKGNEVRSAVVNTSRSDN
ncbi:MAG: MarR family transcriptional regulator [Fimbriimonadaceae bacterium]|nr:MarR family transcriptional regulator [Fimbriimonadaceae bacterium]